MPVKFHWETTVALDGSSTSTPIQFTETLEESGNKALAKTAGGTSPAAKTMQNFILDASGAQENAPVMEKLGRFNAKLQEETRKDLVNTFAFLVNKHLVKKDGGGNRTEDFDCVHYQFNRDVVAGGMTVNLPGRNRARPARPIHHGRRQRHLQDRLRERQETDGPADVHRHPVRTEHGQERVHFHPAKGRA